VSTRDQWRQAIAVELRKHFERVLSTAYESAGLSRETLAEAIRSCVDSTVPVYLQRAEDEAAEQGQFLSQLKTFRFMPPTASVEVEVPRDSGRTVYRTSPPVPRGLTSDEVTAVVTAAIKAATRSAKVKEITTKRNADGSATATIREKEG
jgi:hypothetical protein